MHTYADIALVLGETYITKDRKYTDTSCPLRVRVLIGFRVECIYIKLDFAQS